MLVLLTIIALLMMLNFLNWIMTFFLVPRKSIMHSFKKVSSVFKGLISNALINFEKKIQQAYHVFRKIIFFILVLYKNPTLKLTRMKSNVSRVISHETIFFPWWEITLCLWDWPYGKKQQFVKEYFSENCVYSCCIDISWNGHETDIFMNA